MDATFVTVSVCFMFPLEVKVVSIIRVGTNKKYSDGWDAAFGKVTKKSTKKTASKKTTTKAVAKKKKAKK
ncbi:MAG: hypothetical protein COA78_23575 [Blastopirellula sp.]|nr:MAG: hypothetical protein COA78_23575 [Blastopirellula sp.]